MKCEHGITAGHNSLPNGGWNGPIATCSCCLGTFGYIDMGGISSSGQPVYGRSWQPKDRCPYCGGQYMETKPAETGGAKP